jgi:signal transduction histidine kinase
MYLETAREEEKKRLALEIHDELGHALTAIKLELAWILKKKFLRHDIMIEKVRKMNELIESTIRKVRTISSDLRPSVLDHFGLEAALEWQASEFQKRSAVRCKIHLDKEAINIDEKTSTAIFRIFQEVLTNIAKHAKASRVDVVLEKNHNNIVLKVRDNGKGFKLEKTKKTQSLGILGMTERANAIGGELSINSVIGVGTTVMLIVPLKKN